jgi:short-subunit dehydrogenase
LAWRYKTCRWISPAQTASELNLINLNVTSSVHITKLILQDMVARGQGRILITSSIAGVMPAPYEAVYGAQGVPEVVRRSNPL